MIYVALVLAVTLAVISATWAYILIRSLEKASEERRALEEKLIALCDPVAYTSVKANEDTSLSTPSYIDEDREVELEDGTPKAA